MLSESRAEHATAHMHVHTVRVDTHWQALQCDTIKPVSVYTLTHLRMYCTRLRVCIHTHTHTRSVSHANACPAHGYTHPTYTHNTIHARDCPRRCSALMCPREDSSSNQKTRATQTLLIHSYPANPTHDSPGVSFVHAAHAQN